MLEVCNSVAKREWWVGHVLQQEVLSVGPTDLLQSGNELRGRIDKRTDRKALLMSLT